MTIIYNHFIPFKGFSIINLFGVLFIRYGHAVYKRDIRHELIHSAQIKELLYVPFYVLYFVEWIVRMFQFGFRWKVAYRNISFEKEAYNNENDPYYLHYRRRFGMWRKAKRPTIEEGKRL